MIVYNVKRKWFSLKADAEAYRRAEGLPAEATFKLQIDDRDELAALLNGLCDIAAVVPAPILADVIERNLVTNEPPDFVPEFLAKEWRLKMEGKYRP